MYSSSEWKLFCRGNATFNTISSISCFHYFSIGSDYGNSARPRSTIVEVTIPVVIVTQQ